MIRIGMQFFGGRGGSSGRGGGGGGGGMSAHDEYDAAVAEMEQIVTERKAYFGNPEEYGRFLGARDRVDAAANKILDQEMTDARVEKAMDDYIDAGIREEGVRRTEGWVKTLARTNKDGSPSATAVRNAESYANSVCHDVARSLGVGYVSAYGISESNLNKALEPMMRVARRRMKGGKLS